MRSRNNYRKSVFEYLEHRTYPIGALRACVRACVYQSEGLDDTVDCDVEETSLRSYRYTSIRVA